MHFEYFTSAPWIIQLHAASAIAAFLLGLVQFTAPKGTIPHRTFGYVWVALMASTAITAFFIREINDGGLSWIHIFVPITLYGIVELSIRARRGLTGKHRSTALWMFTAALVIPGIFSFLPGRTMHAVVFGT